MHFDTSIVSAIHVQYVVVKTENLHEQLQVAKLD